MPTEPKVLGASSPSTTYTEIYEPATGDFATGTLYICNTHATTAQNVKVGMQSAWTTGAPTFFLYDFDLAAISSNNNTIQSGPISLANGWSLVVQAATADVDFIFTGIEENN